MTNEALRWYNKNIGEPLVRTGNPIAKVADGLGNVAIQTAGGMGQFNVYDIGKAGYTLCTNHEARAQFKTGLKNYWNKLRSGDAYTIGQTAGMVASVLVNPGDISAAASKASKAESLLGKVGIFSKSIAISSAENAKNIVTSPLRMINNIKNKAADLRTLFSDGKGAVGDLTKSVVVSDAKNANSVLTKVKGKLRDVGTASGAFAKAFGKTYTVEMGKYANTLFGGFGGLVANAKVLGKATVAGGKKFKSVLKMGKADEGAFTSLNSKYVFKDSRIVNQIQDISSQASIDRMEAFNNSLDILLKEYNVKLDEFELLSSKPISELSENELKTMYEIRNSYEMPENGTLMSKVIPDETFKNCINNGEYSKTVVGCVAKAQDTAGLKTYNDYFNTFGLGYDGSPYKNPAKDSMYVMRFTTDNNENIKIPFGGTTDGELEKFSKTCDINVDDLTKMDSPFQGNGFTKNEIGGLGSPEYTISKSAPAELNDYSAIYKVDRSGNETLEAIYFDQNWYVVK